MHKSNEDFSCQKWVLDMKFTDCQASALSYRSRHSLSLQENVYGWAVPELCAVTVQFRWRNANRLHSSRACQSSGRERLSVCFILLPWYDSWLAASVSLTYSSSPRVLTAALFSQAVLEQSAVWTRLRATSLREHHSPAPTIAALQRKHKPFLFNCIAILLTHLFQMKFVNRTGQSSTQHRAV